jgi:hypothetical protein
MYKLWWNLVKMRQLQQGNQKLKLINYLCIRTTSRFQGYGRITTKNEWYPRRWWFRRSSKCTAVGDDVIHLKCKAYCTRIHPRNLSTTQILFMKGYKKNRDIREYFAEIR